MNNFEVFFKNWINNAVEDQLNAIDIISNDTGVDSVNWFKLKFLQRQINDHSGDDFLYVLLENYLCHISNEFDSLFEGYLQPNKYSNIYGNKSYNTDLALIYDTNKKGVSIDTDYEDDEDIKKVENLIKSIPLKDRSELMKNKLFSYIITQTNLQIFSNSDIRSLKLERLNEYNKNIKK